MKNLFRHRKTRYKGLVKNTAQLFSLFGLANLFMAVLLNYLKAYDSVSAAKTNLGEYLSFSNTRRPHQSLDGKTSDTIYYTGLPHESIAA